MIRIEVKPRQDNLFDIWVHADNGEVLLHSSQGYENVEDAVKIVRRIFGPVKVTEKPQTVALRIKYRNGKTHTEQLR